MDYSSYPRLACGSVTLAVMAQNKDTVPSSLGHYFHKWSIKTDVAIWNVSGKGRMFRDRTKEPLNYSSRRNISLKSIVRLIAVSLGYETHPANKSVNSGWKCSSLPKLGYLGDADCNLSFAST